MSPIFHFFGTSPPTHDASQEALLHEPWQILLSQFLTLALVIATMLVSHFNGRKVKKVAGQITDNVGTANGHGTLMEQATVHSKRIGELAEHQYGLKEQLAEHTEKSETRFDDIDERFARMQATLDGHDEKLSTLAVTATTTQDDLRAHVQWEEGLHQKYTIMASSDQAIPLADSSSSPAQKTGAGDASATVARSSKRTRATSGEEGRGHADA